MPSPNVAAVTTMLGKVLASQQLTATTATTVYTVPANTTTKIATACLCNTTAAAVTIIAVAIIPSGAAIDGTHRVISGVLLAANDTLPLNDMLSGALLGPGDYIVVQVNTANAVNVVITGLESS